MHRRMGGRDGRSLFGALVCAHAVCGLATLVTALMAMGITDATAAQKGDDWTSKLEPRTRAIQVCSLAGLNAFAREKKLRPKPDRVVINAANEPKIDAANMSGTGAAVRSGSRWFAFTFTCTLNDAGTKSTGFTYDLGAEIPKTQWEKLGLWQ